MNIQQFYDFCLSKKAVEETFPFDKDTLVLKVGGKMFALTSLSEWENGKPAVNLKADPEKSQQLRAEYDAINPGYHMSKVHWNTVSINQDVPDKMVRELIDHSYDLVFASLSKKLQNDILQSAE
ncbi:MmcQ/YjbR family DNA-binding protein [Flavobacterium silvaticum]|uniref:MmcQ/YjbR family DNA-binding protein n=1 Tax=Flavobacterium silvaticum TaxID=1852020 RepID=A0A972FMJ3_9FLAO|nr:MmcQ/YjbR family DNA-binding protein [Flavobacterium silvaticum]NMH28473.1 MmcQ/YjbR family DNA-binding protein [Flavobacterium silvaticum]